MTSQKSCRSNTSSKLVKPETFFGFTSKEQESVYIKFLFRAIELLQAEILVRRTGLNLEFNNESWEKKVIKIFKAMNVMEKHKEDETHFSKAFAELARFLKDSRRDGS